MEGNTLFVNSEKNEVITFIKKCLEVTDEESFDEDKFSQYPDILVVDYTENLQEFRKRMELFYSLVPNKFKCKVLYISDLDKCSEYMQNALLKFIEDDNDKCICVARAEELQNVLPTVRSRMQIIKRNTKLNFNDFSDYCMKNMIGQDKLYFDVTDGDVGKIKYVGKQIGLWRDIQALLPKRENMNVIFQKLHIVREKDKECFAESNFELLELLINLVQTVFFSMLREECENDWEKSKIKQNIVHCDEEFLKIKKKTYKGKDLTFFFIKLYQQ